jgi:hypothetical protein
MTKCPSFSIIETFSNFVPKLRGLSIMEYKNLLIALGFNLKEKAAGIFLKKYL